MSNQPNNGKRLSIEQDAVILFLYRQQQGSAPTQAEIADALKMSVDDVSRVLRELSELGMVKGPPTLAESAANALREMDAESSVTKDGFGEAALLMASVLSGRADEVFLAGELGFELEFVNLVGARLRNAGVWIGAAPSPKRVDLYTSDGTAFWLDVNVAQGFLTVTEREGDNGEPLYKMTDGGGRHVAGLIKRMDGGR